MTHEDAFLADILEHPDDDGPRLIFADWLEENGDPERAEFIRAQITWDWERGKGNLAPSRDLLEQSWQRWDRARELLERNWQRWVAPLARLVGDEPYEPWLRVQRPSTSANEMYHFPRGFVAALAMAANRFVANAEDLFRLAPLTLLRLHGAGGCGSQLACCKHLQWIREIDFIDYFRAPVEARDMAALAASPHLRRLEVLRLHRNNLGDAGLQALTEAAWLPGLDYLDLTENGLSPGGLKALADCSRLTRLRVLRLGGNSIGDAGADLLARAEWLPSLSHLFLGGGGVSGVGVQALRACAPHLQVSL